MSGRVHVHRRGSLALAVSASMCLPGLAPPVSTAGTFLVDGGVLNNLPIDEMAPRAEGPIIAVDVTARQEIDGVESDEHAPNGREHWPWDEKTPMPSFGESLTRLMLIGATDTIAAAERHADLLICPGDEGVGLLEFHQLDRMREAGRHAAREALASAPAVIFGGLRG
jgi:NTE family protein